MKRPTESIWLTLLSNQASVYLLGHELDRAAVKARAVGGDLPGEHRSGPGTIAGPILHCRGVISAAQGDVPAALTLLREAERLCRAAGDRLNLGRILVRSRTGSQRRR